MLNTDFNNKPRCLAKVVVLGPCTIIMHYCEAVFLQISMHKSARSLFQTAKTMFKLWNSCAVWTWLLLKIRKTWPTLFTWHQTTMQGCSGITILSWVLLTSASLHSLRNDFKQNKTKWRQLLCTVYSKQLRHVFSGVFDRNFHGIIWATPWENVSSGVSDQARHILSCSATEAS